MQPPARNSWHRESLSRVDPDLGTHIVQLTSAPLIHESVHPAASTFSPDSRFLVYSRRQSADSPAELWLADLITGYVRCLADEPGVAAPAVTPDGRWVYYTACNGGIQLRRVSLTTFEREGLLTTDLLEGVHDQAAIRPDGKAYVVSGPTPAGGWALVRFDLTDLTAQIVLQGGELCDPRPEYAPGPDAKLLFQENHGCRFDAQNRCLAASSGYGPDLHVINDDGTALRDVPAGRSDLEMLQGCHCWGDPGCVVATVLRRDSPDQAFRSDRLLAIGLDGQERQTIASGRPFGQPAVSRDGEWWLADEAGTADLLVGCIRTGRHARLLSTGASAGVPTYTHPRAAFSPDGSRVVYTSDVTGVPHVYVADIPPELLNRLWK